MGKPLRATLRYNVSLFFLMVLLLSVNEVTEVKHSNTWNEVSDDQLESYGNVLDNFSIYLLAGFNSCNTIICESTLQRQQISHLCSPLLECVNVKLRVEPFLQKLT